MDLEAIVVVCTADTYVCYKPGLLKVFVWDQDQVIASYTTITKHLK